MQVSLILPIYNEAVRLEETGNQTAKTLRKITSSFEIVIAEDGSSDGTDKIVNKITKKHSFVRHIHSDSRQGRGRALK